LHVSVGGLGEDFVLSGLHVVDYWAFDEGELEVEALAVDLFAQAEYFVEFDGVVADVDWFRGGVP
jgi:hypothetical protein